ncbi:nitrophenyl compound nitroreductase subunit ArsF family protein [Planctomycetota bacterium]
MQAKSIITIVLLLFVAGSIVFQVINESRQPKDQTQGTKTPEQGDVSALSNRITIYYFHGNKRCKTCISFEAFTREAVGSGFPEALKSGKLELRIFNREDTENEHFVLDYSLISNSVIVAEIKDGKQVRWKNLERIWDLVKNKDEFTNYIRIEIKEYLEE